MPDRESRWEMRGPHRVVDAEIDRWTVVDGLPVPVYCQFPDSSRAQALPVVVLSHGLGGDHRSYGLLGAHLASNGYTVLHPQFLDSIRYVQANGAKDGGEANTDEIRDIVRPMLFDPLHWQSRADRARAVIGSLANQAHLPVRLEPENVTALGHSYGAFTSQLLIGVQLFTSPDTIGVLREPAVNCAVLLSPQGSGDRGLTDHSWESVTTPLLVITSTQDRGPHGEGLAWRRECYDRSRSGFKHLVVARDTDHFLGGIHLSEDGPDLFDGRFTPDPQVRRAVSALTLAFIDAVHGDGEASAWLASRPLIDIAEHEHWTGSRD